MAEVKIVIVADDNHLTGKMIKQGTFQFISIVKFVDKHILNE